jgi:CheY-like chemotaxis protein
MRQILVVDNDPTVTSELVECLTEERITVTVSNDGREALKILEGQTFNLVIADIHLAGLEDYAVLNWHTLNRPDTKVIMTKDQNSESVSHAAHRMGAFHCLEKPFNTEHLLDIVQEALNDSGFSGTISKISLADYLQLCVYTTASKIFEVIKGSRKGIIIIQEGVITYAKHGDLEGQEAFNTIFSWQGGRINEIRLPMIPKPNIFIESGFLILEAARIHDEMQMQSAPATAGVKPTGPDHQDIAPFTSEVQAGRDKRDDENRLGEKNRDKIRGLLEKASGVHDYCIFDERDVLMDKSGETNLMHLAPSLHFTLSDALCDLVGGKSLKYLVFSASDGIRYLLFHKDKAYVVSRLKPGVKPGDLFNELVSNP